MSASDSAPVGLPLAAPAFCAEPPSGSGAVLRGPSPRVVEPARAYRLVAALCGVGAVIVVALGQPPAPTLPAAIALLFQAAVTLLLGAAVLRRPESGPTSVRLVALVVIGLATALPGYFFGPNSGFAAVVALALSLTGILSGRDEIPRARLAGWATYAALASSQGLVVALVLADWLPDHSLSRIRIAGHPDWQRAAAHLALQGVFVTAFLCGRVLQRRYQKLVAELEATLQSASLREALLDEARAHYRHALALGREGMFSGQTVGSFRLGRVIGRGGMGEVYEAQRADGSRAAVKVLRGDRLDDAAVVARFARETTVALRIESPQVARVYAAGGLDERLPYIAMEHLDGENLEELARSRGPLDPAAARRLVADLARALEAIHGAGLVHLDVSPRNLVRTREGWKLIDFGGARWADALADETRPVGTPAYVAPERLLGEQPDVRADLYGVAGCLYLALTGRAPLCEDQMRAAVEAQPLAPREIGNLPADVELVLAIGLAKAPAHRFASAAELRDAFFAALDGQLAAELRQRGRAVLRATPWSEPGRANSGEGETATASLPVPPPPDAKQAHSAGWSPALPADSPLSAESTTVLSQSWHDAFRSKMQGLYAGLTTLCVGGALLLGAIAREKAPLWIAWPCIGGILLVLWLDRGRTRRWSQGPTLYWQEMIVAALTVGPAYSLGLHSGFAAVLAITLFFFGAFRATQQVPWIDRRGLVLWSICASHSILFGLILAGIVPDAGNVPVLQPHGGSFHPIATHVLVQSIYIAAFVAGHLLDHSYQHLMKKLEAAAREAGRQQALLTTARAEIERALSAETEGLFSGQHVGRYQAVRLIGRGGMGEVYEGVERASGRRVALKLMRRDRVADPRSLRWFANEASTVARVRSPFVAEVLEVGGLDGELPFIAMEYIDGRSLACLLRDRGRISQPELSRLIADVARGLTDVHAAGILHRDVKPQNIMLTRVGSAARWKLVDFGLAKLMLGGTTENLVAGTMPYMAPEQAAGGKVDARSDLYSFCLVLYRALTGRPAFTGTDRMRILAGRRKHSPPDPRRYTDLSVELEYVLRIGLAHHPEDRFASAAELGEAFEAALAERLPEPWHERGIKLLVQEPWIEPFIRISGYSSSSAG